MKILIVDDSEVIRERLSAVLAEIDGIEVVGQAGDVQGAWETIQRTKPELLILDVRMPGGSGIDLIGTMKTYSPQSKIIVLTNYPFPQYRRKCLTAGADFFFDKSTEFEKAVEIAGQLVCPSSI